jgi:hypothetical protein
VFAAPALLPAAVAELAALVALVDAEDADPEAFVSLEAALVSAVSAPDRAVWAASFSVLAVLAL